MNRKYFVVFFLILSTIGKSQQLFLKIIDMNIASDIAVVKFSIKNDTQYDIILKNIPDKIYPTIGNDSTICTNLKFARTGFTFFIMNEKGLLFPEKLLPPRIGNSDVRVKGRRQKDKVSKRINHRDYLLKKHDELIISSSICLNECYNLLQGHYKIELIYFNGNLTSSTHFNGCIKARYSFDYSKF